MIKKFAEKSIVLCLTLVLLLAALHSCPAYAEEESGNSVYDIVSDMVYAYRTRQKESGPEVREYLKQLKDEDAELGKVWTNIMYYWMYSNSDPVVNMDRLPDCLPDDESLCIVVLGYKLNPDGSMSDELIGRCRTALECSKQYPKAYVAVTGGGTAKDNKTTTEADEMAAWLKKNGLDSKRIITENESQTTVDNAMLLGKIILDDYPDISKIVIVSSDYHVPHGSLLFREFFLLSNYSDGTKIIPVISNAAYKADNLFDIRDIYEQSQDIWMMAELMDAVG